LSDGDALAGFAGFDLERAIRARAARCGIELGPQGARALADHARAVIEANPLLHLTTIDEPEAFVERHLGEAFEGAALLDGDIEGTLLDLGSGNGYPGLPLTVARPGLRPLLAESSQRKAAFLNDVLQSIGSTGEVIHTHVERAQQLGARPPLRLITTRATGGWQKILPRLTPSLEDRGQLMVWAGQEMEAVARRTAWRALTLRQRKPLPDRDRSWIWLFDKSA